MRKPKIMNTKATLHLFVALLFLVGCVNETEVIVPTKSNISESVYASGVVKSEKQYEVFAQVNGKVKNVFVKEGDFVKKGDPLFQLEGVGMELTTANAQITASANDYKQNNEKLIDAKNEIALAKKRCANDSVLLVRQQQLWSQDIGSKVELEQKELSFENSKVNFKKAEVMYKDLMRQLKLASDQSKNNLKMAQSSENNLTIRSEVDGYVYKINVRRGEFATSQKPLAIVGQKNFIIELNVDEFDIVKIKKNQKVIVRMDSYKKQVFEAQISFIYPSMNEQTRSFKVEAVFTKEPSVLYLNLTLEANIVIREKKSALTIPTRYLVNESSVLLENGSVKKVEIGLRDYSSAEILSGIDETTKIILPKE